VQSCRMWREYLKLPAACLPPLAMVTWPCVQAAQELIYPDFMLREPSFITDEQRRAWLVRDFCSGCPVQQLHMQR
jgi:hypothetical protein